MHWDAGAPPASSNPIQGHSRGTDCGTRISLSAVTIGKLQAGVELTCKHELARGPRKRNLLDMDRDFF